MQTVDRNAVVAYIGRCARTIRRHEAYLTRLDAALGDGDHGDNLAMGFQVIEEELAANGADAYSPGELLRRTGHLLVTHVGGASGPLYGTAFIEAAQTAGAAAELDNLLIGEMLEAAALGLARRGRCSVGDKTILDTLRPAADAYAAAHAAGEPFDSCLSAAVRAGVRGMRATRPLVARRGLALRLGARSVGHLDPGAVSCLLLLRSMAPHGASATQSMMPLGATAR